MGKVYLIGGGPGDKGLITMKAVEIMKDADVVIYDFLVSKELLEYAKKDAELVYVGKRAGMRSLTQREINELILEKAKENDIVVRLKGGDPFIFGRGGEEAEYLAEQGIEFEVVPGITSAIAVPAYAGIPLTHRKYASTVAFITGHEDESKNRSNIHWNALKEVDTLVFLMGVRNLSRIKTCLIEAGKAPDTKACIIEWGTLPEQKVVEGKLSEIDGLAERTQVRPPAILVIGDVVKLREKLIWFEKKALFGKSIVVTRPAHQKMELGKILEREGARVIYVPSIDITPNITDEEFIKILENLHTYYAIIFTSTNGVNIFFEALFKFRLDVRELKGIKIFPIGPKTKDAIEKYGIFVEKTPATFTSEGIVKLLKSFDIKGKKILLPRAEIASRKIEEYIRRRGGIPHSISLYRTKAPEKKELIEGRIDIVTFTSSSTVQNFIESYGKDILKGAKIASIGPETTKALKSHGLNVHIEAERHDIKGMVDAIKKYFSNG